MAIVPPLLILNSMALMCVVLTSDDGSTKHSVPKVVLFKADCNLRLVLEYLRKAT